MPGQASGARGACAASSRAASAPAASATSQPKAWHEGREARIISPMRETCSGWQRTKNSKKNLRFEADMRSPKMWPCFLALPVALATSLSTAAQAPTPGAIHAPKSGTVARNPTREQELLQQTKAPDAFAVAVFAGPPTAMYPTCLASAPDGALF